MFNSKSRSAENQAPSATIIGTGTVISGNIECQGDIRVDGVIKGNIVSRSKVIIGAEAIIEGDVYGTQAEIFGRVEGRIFVNDILHLRGNAEVNGDIQAGKLLVEPTACFNGQCRMGANIVELTQELPLAVNE